MINEKKNTPEKAIGLTKNQALDKYADKVLFKDKVKMATIF